jgi:hypothetical protein
MALRVKKAKKPVARPFRWEPPFATTQIEFDLPKGEIRVPREAKEAGERLKEAPFYAYTFPHSKIEVLGRSAELELEPNERGTFRIPWWERKKGTRWYCRGSVLQRLGRPSEQMLYITCDTEENIQLRYRPPAGWTFRERVKE